MKVTSAIVLGMAIFFVAVVAVGQVASPAGGNYAKANCSGGLRSTYVLGPDDELEISGPELDEKTNKPSRIDGEGYVQVPLVGRVQVAGLTVQQCEQELNKRLTTYIREPQIAVSVKELRSQPVSVLGAVNTPGVHQVQGHKTLLEMLSLAGGVRPDAGYRVRITRQLDSGCIPLPNATIDPSGRFSVAEVNLKDIIDAKNPQENISILPHDVISVPKAEMVYVIGDVKRSGGFVLGQDESISILQALSLAEGLTTTADAKHTKILRLNSDGNQRHEITVDVKGILSGKREDVSLRGDDILFIPGSMGKKTTLRAIEAAIQTGTGMAIWRMP
jgi:polysaccharide biosynthesis/export protein